MARLITTCAPVRASLSPSPVMVLTPVLGDAATTSWPRWRRMATVFEPIRPVPPMTTIFMAYPPLSTTGDVSLPCPGSIRAHHSGLCITANLGRRRRLRESQIILHTRGVMPSWRIVFSTFRDCMSFYTARVKTGKPSERANVFRFAPESGPPNDWASPHLENRGSGEARYN